MSNFFFAVLSSSPLIHSFIFFHSRTETEERLSIGSLCVVRIHIGDKKELACLRLSVINFYHDNVCTQLWENFMLKFYAIFDCVDCSIVE